MTTKPIRQVTKNITPNGANLVLLDDGVSMGKASLTDAVSAVAGPLADTKIAALDLDTASQKAVEFFATAAQGGKADTAVQPGDLAVVATTGSQDDMADGTANKNYTATEKTKLGGIEAGADVTDATNVAAAGAVMAASTDASGFGFFLDQDDLTDDDATKAASQQSIKANIDARSPKGKFGTVATLLADTDFGYSASRFAVATGDQIEAGGFRYEVADSGASDQHLTTAGGVKLRMIAGDAGYSFGALDVSADASQDSSAALQALAGFADAEKWSLFHVPTSGRDYLVNDIASVVNPLTITGNFGATYNRGNGKVGWLQVGDGAAAAFDLGASRTSGNVSDNWNVSRVGVKQAAGVATRTKDGFRLTSKTNGPDRAAIFREVSAKGLNAAIHIPDPGVSTALAGLIVENCVLTDCNYAVLTEGNVFGMRFVGNQAEQNISGAISGKFSASIVIADSMLEGQPNAINIDAYAATGNRPSIVIERNYFEGNSGDYVAKLKTTTTANLYVGQNYWNDITATDDIVITGDGNARWKVDVVEQPATYRGITFDMFRGMILPGSRFLHKGQFLQRSTYTGTQMDGQVSHTDFSSLGNGDDTAYVHATEVWRKTGAVRVNSPFGPVYAVSGANYMNVPLTYASGDLIALDVLMRVTEAPTGNTQLWNSNSTTLLGETGTKPLADQYLGWQVVTFIKRVEAAGTGLRFRIYGATTTGLVMAGAAARNYGAHLGDGTDVKSIYPVLPRVDHSGLLRGQATYNPPSIAAGAYDTIQTMTVTGAALGDMVDVSFSLDLAGARLVGWVSAADTVSYQFSNPTGSAIDLASGTVRVGVRPGVV